jgi:acyl-CoA reductase-like NAD-dependent aldehyde dehydrogenase
MKKKTQVGPMIDGKELKTGGAGFFDVVNPATGRVIASEACCDEATVHRAVESSRRAFCAPGWQGLTPSDRARLLLKLADLVDTHAEELLNLELLDVGKPISQLRGGELPLTAQLIRFYAGAADKVEGSVKNTGGGFLSLTAWEPYGVVAGILPWNYPLVNAAMKTAPALAAGNAIVLKPSVETPLSTIALAKLCIDAGIPAGIVNVVTGKGSIAGNALVVHPQVKKVSFTGSTAVGQEIQRLAASQMKTVNLECGGKNALIVFADADLERAAQAALLSAFINAGQLCVSCSRLLVQKPILEKFTRLLERKIKKITVGNPRSSRALVGPMITRAQFELAQAAVEQALVDGCKVAAGGGPMKLRGEFSGGFWFKPTILVNVKPSTKAHNDEIFGPVLSVLPFGTEAEAIAISNSVDYGLSGSVWTADGERALRMIKGLDTGIIWVNTMLTGYPEIPVPPHKMSGTGVELGMEGLLAYCKRKSAVLGYNPHEPVGWNV